MFTFCFCFELSLCTLCRVCFVVLREREKNKKERVDTQGERGRDVGREDGGKEKYREVRRYRDKKIC